MNNHDFNLEYREYKLSDDYPVLVLTPQDTQNTIVATSLHYHFHNCMEIGICYEGEHTLSFENAEYTLSAGSFFILSPYSVHFLSHKEVTDGNNCKYIYIKPEELLRDFYPLSLPEDIKWYKNSEVPFIFSAKDDSVIYNYLNLIADEWSAKRDNYEFAIKGLVLSLMTELTRKISASSMPSSSRSQNMPRLLPALRHMHTYPEKPISIPFLASICNMSASGFRTLFTELMNEAPRHYINRLRLQKACELLYSTEQTILDISIEAGFQSLSNFYRAFNEYYNISPKEWRNKKRAIQKKNIRHSQFLPKQCSGGYHVKQSTKTK